MDGAGESRGRNKEFGIAGFPFTPLSPFYPIKPISFYPFYSMNYKGTIIEESLKGKNLLNNLVILATKVEQVTEKHQTPWLKQWTLHIVEIQETDAERLAEVVSKNLDYSHGNAWYADFKNKDFHYIIFKNKIFKIPRNDALGYRQAKQYGIGLGIPEHQVDFSPEIG